jgi:VWFA-related protein
MIDAILFAHRQNRSNRGSRGGIAITIPRRNARPDGRKVMERLACETGGGFYAVSDDNPIDQVYAQIEDELRSQYSIGYTPSRADTTGKYRKLKLMRVRRGLVVRTRDGYYPT